MYSSSSSDLNDFLDLDLIDFENDYPFDDNLDRLDLLLFDYEYFVSDMLIDIVLPALDLIDSSSSDKSFSGELIYDRLIDSSLLSYFTSSTSLILSSMSIVITYYFFCFLRLISWLISWIIGSLNLFYYFKSFIDIIGVLLFLSSLARAYIKFLLALTDFLDYLFIFGVLLL